MPTLLRQKYVVVAMLPQRWIVSLAHDTSWELWWQRRYSVETATSNSQRLIDFDVTTLHQRRVIFMENVKCELCMVVWQHFHRISTVFKINNGMTFVWYARSILRHSFQAIVSLSCCKFPTVTFKRFRKTGMDKMESCSPKLSIRNCPALNFISNFKTITFQKSGRKIFN